MISTLRGILTHKDHGSAIIECAGVGYGIAASTQTLQALAQVGEEVRVLVHTHVAEDALKLYGFATPQERRSFDVLLATTGVGPRLALAILSTLTPEELLRAVSRKDRSALTHVPGVGPKKAERLLLELSGRMTAEQTAMTSPGTDVVGDVASALTHLGFDANQAFEAARAAHQALPKSADVATLTRLALQSISGVKGQGAGVPSRPGARP